ncbi:hypothetical protein B0H11DRAFT_2249779 [Mycena galericulata]|nr:hypothetical protein B0H11DRAFT_2249779 [Mycena galericulata]
MAANVAVYEQMALNAGREKSEAEAALRDLRRRSDEFKAKKRGNNPQENSKESAAQIESLTDKLRSMYRKQKKLSGELQRVGSDPTNQLLPTKKLRKNSSLEKASKATAESGLRQEYAELKISHETLKAVCLLISCPPSMQPSHTFHIEAQNGQLQQESHDLWTSKKEMAKTCTEVCDAAERMDREGMQLRSTITALENRVGNLTGIKQALQLRMVRVSFVIPT